MSTLPCLQLGGVYQGDSTEKVLTIDSTPLQFWYTLDLNLCANSLGPTFRSMTI